MALNRSLILTVLKRLLEAGLFLYAIVVIAVVATGGFHFEFFGISISARRLGNPLQIFTALALTRLFFSIGVQSTILLICSIFLSMGMIEIFLRAWNPPLAGREAKQIHQAHPVLGWNLVPGASGVGKIGEVYQINSAGFRDKEVKIGRKKDGCRIMAIGDSFTFGSGVDLEATYPKQLEDMLNKKGYSCEVINCGIVAHGMWQHFEMLKSKVLPYRPDLVILGLFEDDLLASEKPYQDPSEWSGKNPFKQSPSSVMLQKSYLFNFIRNIFGLYEYKYRYRLGHSYLKNVEERKKVWGPDNPTNDNYKSMAGKLSNRHYMQFSNLFKKFVAAVKESGAKTLIVYIPDSVQLNEPHLQAINRYLFRLSENIGAAFVDTTPPLEAEKDRLSLYLFPFDAHNSPAGLKVIAETIAEKIVESNLLPIKHSLSKKY